VQIPSYMGQTNKHYMRFNPRKNLLAIAGMVTVASVATYLIAADHIDSPSIAGTGFDIADLYAFQSPENPNNMVFIVTWKGLLSPSATAGASFEDDLMIEINIDNSSTKDNVEDMVIQANFKNGKLLLYGPSKPSETGLTSKLVSGPSVEATITTYGSTAEVGEKNGVKVFAGPRDDPFFFDLNRYKQIIAGTATSFSDPGMDTFAGTNVLALVIELPKSMLGSSTTLNTWVTTNREM
jgi:hypothetical protein